jgi:GNAT superfamily N-acetyltransferase
MITIRKAKDDDTLKLEMLFQATRQKTFTLRSAKEFQIGDYAKSVEEDEVFVAEKNNIIGGFISIYPQDNFIHNLFVLSSYQRYGIGKLLLKKAEENLSSPMTLKIALDNINVSVFYEKQGWHQASLHHEADEPYALYVKTKISS